MTDETSSLVLEMLRAMRGDMETIKDKITNIELRLTSTDGHVANLHTDYVIMQGRIDGLDKRLERIERRLELTSA